MARAVSTEIEETPEADRLEGFPHPRETEVLFGHEPAERELAAALAGGAMHHGWLFTGPEGIGKAALAYKFAAHALASPSERAASGETLDVPKDSVAARQVRALSHPGLMVIRRPWSHKDKRFAASIPVDEVRRLKSFLGHRAGEGAWRIVILDTADELNVNAANALLKALEEPPPLTAFLLVSSEPGRLLPTIRSRCRVLPLAPLSGDALRAAVSQALTAADKGVPDARQWAVLEKLAEGSARRGLALLENGGLDLNGRLSKVLASLPTLDWLAVHGLGDELQPIAADQKFELFFDLLSASLGRLIHAAAAGREGGDEAALAAKIIGAARLAAWAELWETIAREKAIALALNLDRRMLVLDTFSRIEAAARV